MFGFRKSNRRLNKTPLWVDQWSFWLDIGKIEDEDNKQALTNFRRNGFAVLKGNVPSELCDQVVTGFHKYAETHFDEANKYKDEHGLYDRLANLHLASEAASQLLNSTRTLRFLRSLFEAEPTIVGSLYFDKGSGQSIHRDTPAFFTNPLNHYVGVWTALEDVSPDAGPLVYYEKGHKVESDYSLYKASVQESSYFERVVGKCKEKELKLVKFLPEKGDTLIWHPQLPHGGFQRIDKTKSRRSIVSHYMSSQAEIFSPNHFFSEDKVLPSLEQKFIRSGELMAIDHGGPKFFVNREEGNFDEF